MKFGIVNVIRKSFLSFAALIICLGMFPMGTVSAKRTFHKNSQKRHIPIAMALDDEYLYPTVVSITSMMKNKSKNTVYDYYIMHPHEFSVGSKKQLNSLAKKYSGCNINLIDMGDAYKSANSKGHITTPTYYRLSLSELLPKLSKILWIDGDTLIFRDLSSMYFDTNMDGLYYRGLLDENVNATSAFGIENDHCICAGVMVVNLDELRKDNVVVKFQDFIEKNNEKLAQHDQTVINCVCAEKTAKLDPKYCLFNYLHKRSRLPGYLKKLTAKDKYTIGEILQALRRPALVHCVVKPWRSRTKYFKEWWQYAKLTGCYGKIFKKYGSVFKS